MLTYTFNNMLTSQAIIARDESVADAYGAPTKANFQYHLTVPCALVWDRSSGVRSANRTWVTPARDAPLKEGLMLMPTGTDVTEQDRISQIQDREGNLTYPGDFTISAVVVYDDHIELNVIYAHLGE